MNEPAAGSRAAQLEEIFREHYRLTYTTAYAITGNAENAEDVVQSIFLGLLRREAPPDLREAKAEDPAHTTKEELRQMLQKFVEEKFKLKFHIEIRPRAGYHLAVAKGGPKFQSVSDPEDEIFKGGPLTCCVIYDTPGITCCFINAKITMGMLAGLVGQMNANGPVMDMTGLSGVYDIRLTVNSIPRQPGLGGGGGPRGGGGGDPLREPREYDPPLAKALEQQLGLTLESGKMIPLEWFIVDSFEKPDDTN
jgi:uncharacterized protein (TIGR03435 family)